MANNIYFTSTTEIQVHASAIGGLLLNGGVHPDIPAEKMRLFGYREQLDWPDHSKGPGILEPVCLWYIRTPNLKILVDTGVNKENCDLANRVYRSRGRLTLYSWRPEHDIHDFLRLHGTSEEEIDLVILTHLHFDHFCNAVAYPRARFLVQRDELALALTPPAYMPFHWREFSPYLISVLDRVESIEGDAKVCEGVEVWRVGGHTVGSVAVAVETSVGKAVIAGDFFYNYRNIDFSWPIGSLESGIAEWERNCRRLKRRADILLPNHDYELWNRHPGGTIG